MGPSFGRAVYQALSPREHAYGATLNRGLNFTMPNKVGLGS